MPGFLAKLDRFTIGLIVSVGAGILVPCSGVWDTVFSRLSDAAIVLLFFLYGAKLSRRSVWEGLMHWRLQGLVAASTFVIFPLLGMVSMPLWNSVLGPDLCMGMLYVCMLPSTVQSSIAFTSMAGGNVAAAICSASVSSLLGAFLSRRLRFSREDRIAIIFCGSKKSLATGIPMMNVIFAGAPIGLLVIPIMVFHQLQLMVCSFLARKWAKDVGKGEQL